MWKTRKARGRTKGEQKGVNATDRGRNKIVSGNGMERVRKRRIPATSSVDRWK